MIRAQRRRGPRGATPSELADDNAGLIALWCLRILVRLGGHKELLYGEGFAKDEILQAIGLDHLRGQEIDVAVGCELLSHRLDAVEAERPVLSGPLAANLDHLAQALGLSPSDRSVLAFATLYELRSGTRRNRRHPGVLAQPHAICPRPCCNPRFIPGGD